MRGGIDEYYRENNHKPSYIITYIDFKIAITDEMLRQFVTDLYDKNIELRTPVTKVVKKDNRVFDIANQYQMKYVDKQLFYTYLHNCIQSHDIELENSGLDWYFTCCVDKEAGISRLFLKINHIVCDGIKLIEILRSSDAFDIKKNISGRGSGVELSNKMGSASFSASNLSFLNKLYYHIFGLVVLGIINVLVVIRLVSSYLYDMICSWMGNGYHDHGHHGHCSASEGKNIKTACNKKNIDFFECQPLHLQTIKCISKLKGVSVNDFMYAIMVRADHLYYQTERSLTTLMPFSLKNIGDVRTQSNHFLPIVNIIGNHLTCTSLLHRVRHVFNCYKYSSFVKLFSLGVYLISRFIGWHVFSIYNNSPSSIDYFFSNIIGPDLTNTYATDFKFFVLPTKNEVLFNVTSSANNMNITCTYFDHGKCIDKERFRKCVYDAYIQLIRC